MKSAIDAAGRVVIPKALRERLGLSGGSAVEIRERDGIIEIEAAPTPMKLIRRGGRLVAVPDEAPSALTDDSVRDALERTRR
jgi:AbrB family looped-hinge helix DNA binding protein